MKSRKLLGNALKTHISKESDSLEEINKPLDMCDLPKLNQGHTNNFNRPIKTARLKQSFKKKKEKKEEKKKLPTKKAQTQDRFAIASIKSSITPGNQHSPDTQSRCKHLHT